MTLGGSLPAHDNHPTGTVEPRLNAGHSSRPCRGSRDLALKTGDSEQEIKATRQTIPENKTHTGKDFNQPKVMERRAGVDLNRDSGNEEETPDLSPKGGEGVDCGSGQGRGPGRDSHGPPAIPAGPAGPMEIRPRPAPAQSPCTCSLRLFGTGGAGGTQNGS